MRTIAIGDIHGCAQALQGILDEIEVQASDRLIFLGDYVDRGPDSKGVIETLLELKQRCCTVFLLGNHEIMFRGALSGLPPELWLEIGGRQTVTSYGGLLEHVSRAHRNFLLGLQPYFETDTHIFVHANYDPALPLVEQTEEALFWYHLTDYVPGPHYTGKHVILGHTPQPSGHIGYYGHMTCLDTCCFGGYWLTAMDVETGEVWQVSRAGHPRQNWRLIRHLWRRVRQLTIKS